MRLSFSIRDWRLIPSARATRDLLWWKRSIASRIISSSRFWTAIFRLPSGRGNDSGRVPEM